MHWRWLPAWFLAVAPLGQPVELSPDVLTLARIKLAMSETLARQPNYTCIQQIERSHRHIPKRKFELHDLVRLEVALVEGRELFAWPGAGKFEEGDLTEMVTGGAIGTGDFALHARAVFQSSAPTFKYAGDSVLRGRKVTHYDFVVPLISSGYQLKVGERRATVAYHGSFWADAETQQLLRLQVEADDIPASLRIASARQVMDYGQVRIGSSDFLLPIASELSVTDADGNENRNRTEFKACRQYIGQSVLTFGEAPENGADRDVPVGSAPTLNPGPPIPAGTFLEIRLFTGIDSDNSAVGDPVAATLEQPLKIRRELLYPKGATLRGRILRLERHGEFEILDLQFSTITTHAAQSMLLARIEAMTSLLRGHPGPLVTDTSRGGIANSAGLRIRGSRVRLPAGTRLRLRTLELTSH